MTEKDLFETYKKDIYKTCFFMVHNAIDAEDICQDVFITVFRHDWKSIEHLKTWLIRVTVNHCLNHLKKNKSTRAKEEKLQLQSVTASEKAVDMIAVEREGFIVYISSSLVLKRREKKTRWIRKRILSSNN